jgi:hypothetical protein
MPYSPPPDPDDDLIFHDQWRHGNRIAGFAVGDLGFQIGRPLRASSAIRLASSVPMKSDSPRIATPRLFEPQQTTSSGSCLVAIHPEDTAGGGVERDDVVGPLREIHDAVDHDRRRLPASVCGD